MLLKVLLALRDQRHQVKVAKINGAARPELVRSHPGEADRRAAAVAAWGGSASPRQQPLATIDTPLPRRTQTILAHRLPAAVRERIETGIVVAIDTAPRTSTQPAETVGLPPAGDEG